MPDLAEHFRDPALAWLVERLAIRAERGEPLDSGTATLAAASADQRRAIDDLFGRRSTGGRALTVDLARLAETLGLDGDGLRALAGSVLGRELVDHRDRREQAARAWDDIFATPVPDAIHRAWLDALRADGLLKRLSGNDPAAARELLGRALAVTGSLPRRSVLLASLAAGITGDSHALDRGRPLATLCLRFLALKYDIARTSTAAGRREAWAAAGVTIDDLSAPALCLNLPAAPGSRCAGWLDWHCRHGEPFHLPWRQLAGYEPPPDLAQVFVCENPAVVSEAATRLGARCRPLVCLNGRPSSTVTDLLAILDRAGVVLRVRADFDPAGLAILDGLCDRLACRPWRMDVKSYESRGSGPVFDAAPVSRHFPELAASMARAGRAVYEEELVGELLEDLGG